MQLLRAILFCFISFMLTSVSNSEELSPEYYEKNVQPIFNQRCLACHSCFNAPCQLNLQSYEGFTRGANKLNIYDGARIKSVEPIRLWIDAHTEREWRKKGFYEVSGSSEPEQNLFLKFLNLRVSDAQRSVNKQVAESNLCVSNVREFERVKKDLPEVGMPYGLPPLTNEEIQILTKWIEHGAPGPSTDYQFKRSKNPAEVQKILNLWEGFLNAPDLEHKLVSRYLYEHLFLAHIYFSEKPDDFYRLVRSRTNCTEGIIEIATRRPNDDPGMKDFFYCIKKFPGTVVMKTHIPYEFSLEKLEEIKKIFWEKSWKVTKLPSYDPGVAENPFVAFNEIPVKARYKFLLQDAHYEVNTFIKGPVCNGSMAVNSIQEQFFVFFLTPDADNMVQSIEYEKKVDQMLMLPGVWGSEVEFVDTPVFMKKLVQHREAYRKTRSEWLKKNRPQGYSLSDIWDGDKINDNAVLTVFRHDDNAVVMKGAVGDLSKTIFVVDYPLLERLVYNLVVNFDVFGNLGHKYLTRMYMDLIRMEAEELFLMFLPPEDRLNYRRSWYRGLLSQAMMTYIFPTVGVAEPTSVLFHDGVETKKQMVEKVLFDRLNTTTRGKVDEINWRHVQVPKRISRIGHVHKNYVKSSQLDIETELRKIASVQADNKNPFARYFSDLSLLRVTSESGTVRVFSIIHNKEHENISWSLAESLRFSPEEDTLTIREGYWGAYVNMIFDVTEKKLPMFVAQANLVRSESDYNVLVNQFGIRRTNPNFWQYYDWLTEHFKKYDPVEFGYLDLTRYAL